MYIKFKIYRNGWRVVSGDNVCRCVFRVQREMYFKSILKKKGIFSSSAFQQRSPLSSFWFLFTLSGKAGVFVLHLLQPRNTNLIAVPNEPETIIPNSDASLCPGLHFRKQETGTGAFHLVDKKLQLTFSSVCYPEATDVELHPPRVSGVTPPGLSGWQLSGVDLQSVLSLQPE